MTYVLGVDGGTTKTVALVATLDGGIVGAGRGGSSNIYDVSTDVAFANLDQAVATALNAARIGASSLVAGAFSLCGADWPEDFELFQARLIQRDYGERIVVVNDAVGGLRAGSADGCGVAVVCGTGGATAARAPDGATWHSSFWQEVGGSVDLARQALRAVYRAELGIEPPTALTARVLDYFDQTGVENLLHFLTARREGRSLDVTGLARILLDEAADGDSTAGRIVRAHAMTLGDYALAGARRVGIEGTGFTLVLAGGVFRHPGRLLPESLVERVRTTSPSVRVVEGGIEPVVGALRLALELAGTKMSDSILTRTAALPEPDFLMT